jgi:ParB family chromosome partitioning protein
MMDDVTDTSGIDVSKQDTYHGREQMRRLPVQLIQARPQYAHRETDVSSLAKDISGKGVQVPIRVVELGNGRYGIIDGKRRWRAAMSAGLRCIPAIVLVNSGEQDAYEVWLMEYFQRSDLHALDKAMTLHTFKGMGYREKKLASLTGRSVPHISQSVTVAQFLRDAVADGCLSWVEVQEMDLPISTIYSAARVAKAYDNVAHGVNLLRKAHAKHMSAAHVAEEASDDIYRREFEEERCEEARRMAADSPRGNGEDSGHVRGRAASGERRPGSTGRTLLKKIGAMWSSILRR